MQKHLHPPEVRQRLIFENKILNQKSYTVPLKDRLLSFSFTLHLTLLCLLHCLLACNSTPVQIERTIFRLEST